MRPVICFCATGKTGLGHLRRVTTIATALHRLDPQVQLELISNGSGQGLAEQELALYRQIQRAERGEMAARLATAPPDLVVVDTAVVPGIDRLPSRRALILRETRPEMLHHFALPCPWDLLLLPHPPDDWRPPADAVPARRQQAVGWIYRPPTPTTGPPLPLGSPPQPGMVQLLIAAGAGGGPVQNLREALARLLPRLRQRLNGSLEVIQVLGPRAAADARLPTTDRTITPGSRLNELFDQADLVVSAMGYNSALELAGCRVPVLMSATPATYDDQRARALRLHQRLGWALDAADAEAALDWATDTLHQRRRREPLPLGPNGADAAARALLELLYA